MPSAAGKWMWGLLAASVLFLFMTIALAVVLCRPVKMEAKYRDVHMTVDIGGSAGTKTAETASEKQQLKR